MYRRLCIWKYNGDFLIKLSQELIHIENDAERIIACDATLMQQSAEWGVCAFQSSTPCIKDWMNFKECGKSKVTLMMMILLYNLQARVVGINQLQSFYTVPLDHDKNLNCVPCYNSFY